MEKSIRNILNDLELLESGIACSDELRAKNKLTHPKPVINKRTSRNFVNLDTLIPGVVGKLCSIEKANGIKVKVFKRENIVVPANKALLSSVLYTLIRCAIENHYPEGEERFVLVMVLEEADCIAIEISDNGPGIPEELLCKFNDVFLSKKSDVSANWLELGLYNLKRLVATASASIELVGEEDAGSTYRILIPKDQPM